MQMSRTRYYRLRDEGRLTEPNHLVTAAVNLGINTVELLARYGHVNDGDVLQYADQLTAPARTRPAAGAAVAVHAGLTPAAGTRNRLSTLMPRPARHACKRTHQAAHPDSDPGVSMFVVAAVCTIAALILRHSTWRIYWESGATRPWP